VRARPSVLVAVVVVLVVLVRERKRELMALDLRPRQRKDRDLDGLRHLRLRIVGHPVLEQRPVMEGPRAPLVELLILLVGHWY